MDDDVIAKIREKMRSDDGKTFKEAVNETLRHGLLFEDERRKKPRKPFKVKAKNLGVYPHLNYDDIGALLEEIEGPFHK